MKMIMNTEEPWVSFLIRTEDPPVWKSGAPGRWDLTGDENVYHFSERVRLDSHGRPSPPSVMSDKALQAAGAHLIGGWRASGAPWGEVDVDAYMRLCPLGNAPAEGKVRAGRATGPLGLPRLAGYAQRQLGEDGRLYPETTSPITLKISHTEVKGSHGWAAEVVGPFDRSPAARCVGVYADADCTEFLYKSAPFAFGADLELYAQSPLGEETAGRGDVHVALLYGAVQEGFQTLPRDEDSVTYLFWRDEAGAPPGEPKRIGVRQAERGSIKDFV